MSRKFVMDEYECESLFAVVEYLGDEIKEYERIKDEPEELAHFGEHIGWHVKTLAEALDRWADQGSWSMSSKL